MHIRATFNTCLGQKNSEQVQLRLESFFRYIVYKRHFFFLPTCVFTHWPLIKNITHTLHCSSTLFHCLANGFLSSFTRSASLLSFRTLRKTVRRDVFDCAFLARFVLFKPFEPLPPPLIDFSFFSACPSILATLHSHVV